jgi:uncharacterized damage-inducible protein DinB
MTPLIVVYRFSHGSLERNLDGVTDAESLQPPAEGGNCVNWLVGHLLWSRNRVHELLRAAPAWPERFGPSDSYHRGVTGFNPDEAVPLGELRAAMAESQAIVVDSLQRVDDRRLSERATDKMTVGEQLAFLGFHEGYHAGQVGLLRRLLGRTGAIK